MGEDEEWDEMLSHEQGGFHRETRHTLGYGVIEFEGESVRIGGKDDITDLSRTSLWGDPDYYPIHPRREQAPPNDDKESIEYKQWRKRGRSPE